MFFVCAAAILVAGWAIEVARMFAKRVAKERVKETLPTPPDMPAVAVILPVKGAGGGGEDEDAEGNIRALLTQNYPRYRLLFAIESETDPVLPLLRRIAESSSVPVEIVVAGIATTRGQKIHNQLAAVARTTESDTHLVFMDADARPKQHWLRELVLPLKEPDVGATTGFRFYVPAPDPGAPSYDPPPRLASVMLSVINASVAALLGPDWRNIAWGGSMAITRANFFAFGVDRAWQNALSDDYVLSYCVKTRAKRRIQFVQSCLVGSVADMDWPAFWEFATRQYKITRICAPFIWLIALGAPLMYTAAFVYLIVFYAWSLIAGRPDHPLLLMLVLLYACNVIRGRLLLEGGIAGLPEHKERLEAARFWYTWGYPAHFVVNLLALLRSAAGKKITWRGITYTMHNRLRTTLHGRATQT
jgi:cellulose synthase/poly-beta-1,6-N-acetylglucosamine synthase-like glycosyltransferase